MDHQRKKTAKLRADAKHHLCRDTLKIGDKVLCRQQKKNNVTTLYDWTHTSSQKSTDRRSPPEMIVNKSPDTPPFLSDWEQNQDDKNKNATCTCLRAKLTSNHIRKAVKTKAQAKKTSTKRSRQTVKPFPTWGRRRSGKRSDSCLWKSMLIT